MFDSILPSLQNFVSHTLTQFVGLLATLLGGWAAADYFWQKWKVTTGKATVNKSLLCRLFPRFCFRKAYLRHVSFEHRVFNIKGLRTWGTYSDIRLNLYYSILIYM